MGNGIVPAGPPRHPIRLQPLTKLPMRRIEEIMDWVIVFFVVFKVAVLGTAAFFAIKAHYDGEKQEREEERERQDRIDASTPEPGITRMKT